MAENNRNTTRIHYSAHALVKSNSKGTIGGKVRDISLKAMYLQIKPVFEIDEKVKVEIVLLGADSELVIRVSATVLRKDEKGIALRFRTPLEWWPVLSFFPLHNLDNGTDE